MSIGLMWSNLITYSVQIGLVVGLAAFVPTLLRLRAPRGRLYYWHILLAACLLLPLVRPWRAEVANDNVQITTTVLAIQGQAPGSRSIPWTELGLALLVGGIVSRFVWLAVGYGRLQRYRRQSQPFRVEMMGAAGVDFRLSEDVASPVTFGLWRPVVLLPVRFPELPQGLRDAILWHELLHVERHDWFFTLLEEVVRAVFWFHPAIWWLLGEIQLSREQAVDHEVIQRTNAREEYVDALLAIAGARAQADLAPAPLFLRKRHLKQRVVSIFKEVHMSRTKLLSTLAAGLGVLTLACWLVTSTLPLAAAPQSDGAGVAVDLGGAAVLHRTPVAYPAAARARGIQGEVSVELTLDGAGNVADARIIAGPEDLRKAVLQSVLQWHFARESGATRRVTISFRSTQVPAAAAAPGAPATTATVQDSDLARRLATQRARVQPTFVGRTVKTIRVFGLPDSSRTELMGRLPVHEGDVLTADSMQKIAEVAKAYDEHLSLSIGNMGASEASIVISTPNAEGGVGGVIGGVVGGVAGGVSPAASGTEAPDRIRVGGNIAQTKLISQARPLYPPEAKEARIQGVVKLAAVIGKDGTIKELTVISGHPLLVPSALDAVKQWVYDTTLLNGNPVEVATQIDVNYTLSQ